MPRTTANTDTNTEESVGRCNPRCVGRAVACAGFFAGTTIASGSGVIALYAGPALFSEYLLLCVLPVSGFTAAGGAATGAFLCDTCPDGCSDTCVSCWEDSPYQHELNHSRLGYQARLAYLETGDLVDQAGLRRDLQRIAGASTSNSHTASQGTHRGTPLFPPAPPQAFPSYGAVGQRASINADYPTGNTMTEGRPKL